MTTAVTSSPLIETPSRPAVAGPRALLVVVLLLSAALRVWGLGQQSLWNDELSSWRRSNYPTVAEVMRHGVMTEIHPPGYHLLLWAVQQWGGESEVWLRAPSAVAGVLAVAAIY